MDKIQDLLMTLLLLALCGIAGYLLRTNKQRILEMTTKLIQMAEDSVQGSGMGEAKKQLVIAQLEAAGIRVNAWLSAQIDVIVATLNSRGAWLSAQEKQQTAGLTGGEKDE
mgnify:CR=1 FL=1